MVEFQNHSWTTVQGRFLPFICANPDLTVKVKGGKTMYMPGLLEKYYYEALKTNYEAATKMQVTAS